MEGKRGRKNVPPRPVDTIGSLEDMVCRDKAIVCLFALDWSIAEVLLEY